MKQITSNGKSGFVSVRIDRQRFELLKDIAEREDRPLASVLRRAVDRELELDEQEAAA